MFRNWMRSRLGLDQAPEGRSPLPMPVAPFGGPKTVGFQDRGLGGNTEMGGAGIEGWTPRPQPIGPMDGGFGQVSGNIGGGKSIQPEGWTPKENPYNPPQQTFAATPDESYSSFGRRPGQAYSPFAW